jgi:hypothetical protein
MDESSDDERLLGLKPRKKAAYMLDSSSSESDTACAALPCDADNAESPVVQRKPRSRKIVLQSDTESSSSSENDHDESDADDVQALTKDLSDLKPFAKVSRAPTTALLLSLAAMQVQDDMVVLPKAQTSYVACCRPALLARHQHLPREKCLR